VSKEQILKNTNAEILNQFNASLFFDKKLYLQDIDCCLINLFSLIGQMKVNSLVEY
jgi:hypothetical protein